MTSPQQPTQDTPSLRSQCFVAIMMRRLISYVLCGLLLAPVGCDTVDDDCGPFKGKFKTVGFTTAAYRFGASDALSAEPNLSAIEGDTLAEGELGIRMLPHQEAYFASHEAAIGFSLIPAAYACSPPIPASDEVIRDIHVYTDKAFDAAHAADDNLAELFDVVVLNRARGVLYERMGLKDFLRIRPNAVDEMILMLNTAPETVSSFQFTVRYYQEGRGLAFYEFTTDTIMLGPG